jgi:cytochrome c553
MKPRALLFIVLLMAALVVLSGVSAQARPPIRKTFFQTYPNAAGTQLDNLPSKATHCGVCHFDFNGGGTRNPYGLGVEVGINGGLTNEQAILAIQGSDSDADGFSNLIEITDTINFTNTPTFPGLTQSNKGSTSNIPLAEIEPYLTPSGGTDTTPPFVVVGSPNGGENLNASSYYAIAYTATDASGISHVNVYLSDDGGMNFKPVATNVTPGTGYSWFVPNRPGSLNHIRVVAYDNAGNPGSDDSNASFTIIGRPAGHVPTTLRDVDMAGTQPHEGAILDDPDVSCASCHGNYDSANEPWYTWRGSMMAQAARDPFFFACMAVAEQDAPSVGDVCIRCHTPGGWQEGRSVDTSGDLLTAKDRHGIHCDFCHRAVDYDYKPGISPLQDVDVLADISPLPLQYGNGQFITDPSPLRRGPFADAQANHAFVESPFHRSSNICGTCHDVSNPVFDYVAPGDYAPNAFDQPHPDMNVRNMAPIERTFSEWSQSAYAATGVYAPQFAGNKPDGIVSTCQDCHMRDVDAKGCNQTGVQRRPNLPLHDLMGGNTFIPDIVASLYPDEVDVAQLQAAKQRAVSMLQKAATLAVTPETFGVTVRVTNETAHKLPSGYPEGRRIWLNVKAIDAGGQIVFESGAYDPATGVLTHDDQAKVYEIHLGLSPGLAGALGMTAGVSFHFVLNDTVYSDNRVPPRGFTNSNFQAIQSPPVHYSYADGQHWDDTQFFLPVSAESARVTLYYQSTSKEYVEFLRDENTTNSAGQVLFDAWAVQGRSAPVAMASVTVPLDVTVTSAGEDPGARLIYGLSQNYPNPLGSATSITYSLARREHVVISVFDLSGRYVRSLVDEVQDPSRYSIAWDGRDANGEPVSAGIYFINYKAGTHTFSKKAIVLR